MTPGADPESWRPRLAKTIKLIEKEASAFNDEWWMIGSAAAALAGAAISDVADVDLLLSESDACRLIMRWASAPSNGAASSDRFRSKIFARFELAPLAIEAFGGFEICIRGKWRPVLPMTRVSCSGVFTPSVAEQIALLETMGRAKDRARAEALRACL